MKKNVGIYDTIIRIIFAIVVAILFFTNAINGVWAIVLGILAIVLLVTGLLGFCPLYAIIGVRTCPMKEKPNNP
jgi:hypothetical protein